MFGRQRNLLRVMSGLVGLLTVSLALPALAALSISNVEVKASTADVTITWQTSEAATGQVTITDQNAGGDPNYKPLTLPEQTSASTTHSLTVKLIAGHTYTATIKETTSSGQTASQDKTFMVAGSSTSSPSPSPTGSLSPSPSPSGSLSPSGSSTPFICPTTAPTPGQIVDSRCIGQGGQTNGQTGPGQGGSPRGPGDPNFSAPAWFSQTLFTLGIYQIRGIDLLWWIAVLLLLAATLLELFFYVKRRRLWGVVYDARTKGAIEMAVVRLFDQEHHKLLETRVTPRSGRYSFLGEPGEYYLEVTKDGYHFPSRIVTSRIDNEYTNIYRGEVVKLGVGQSLIAPDIPVDSESGEIKQPSAWRQLYPFLDAIRLPVLILAFAALLGYIYFAIPTLIAEFLFALVAILFLVEFLIRRGRK